MSKIISIHRYRWTGEEIAVIAVLGAFGLGMATWAVMEMSLGKGIIAGLALFLSVYSYIIANGRKKKSQVTARYDTESSELMVSGHTFEGLKNTAVLNETTRVSVRGKSSEEFTVRDIVIMHTGEGDNEKTLKFPLRLLTVDSFWDIFKQYVPLSKDERTKEGIEFGRNSEKKKK